VLPLGNGPAGSLPLAQCNVKATELPPDEGDAARLTSYVNGAQDWIAQPALHELVVLHLDGDDDSTHTTPRNRSTPRHAGASRTRHFSRRSATSPRDTPHSTRPTYTSCRPARAASSSAEAPASGTSRPTMMKSRPRQRVDLPSPPLGARWP
jgi:hypothetical protein